MPDNTKIENKKGLYRPCPACGETAALKAAAAEAAEAEVTKLRGVLKEYKDQYCEGWCVDGEPTSDDCGGCPARLALAQKDKKDA